MSHLLVMNTQNTVKSKSTIYGAICHVCYEDIRRGSLVAAFKEERMVTHWRCRHVVESIRESMQALYNTPGGGRE